MRPQRRRASLAPRMSQWGGFLVQLAYLAPLLRWLEAQNSTAGGFAEGRLDLALLGAAGHSRGGKLAALHLAGAALGTCSACPRDLGGPNPELQNGADGKIAFRGRAGPKREIVLIE